MSLLISPKEFNLPKISKKTIIFFNLQHLFMFKEMVQGGKVKSFGPAKRFSYDLNNERITVLGGMIGAPLATLNIENAISGGAREFITYGTAGWLSSTPVSFGSVFSPISGVDETGMAKDYESPTDEIKMDQMPSSIPICGKIVSINSFYRTTMKKVERYRSSGVDLIDMESAPLHYIIPKLGGRIQSVFVVSDQFSSKNQWKSGMMATEFNAGVEASLQKINTLF